jgi:lysophospholipase L1-like esterase
MAVAIVAPLILVSALASPAVGAAAERQPAPPKGFYLSLGDSMAFGLQFDRFFEMLDAGTYRPEAFDTGYTDFLANRMRRLRPDQRTVNLSCPGESTDTMINGPCAFTLPEPDGPGVTLHTNYAGSQLDAAVSFLRAHPGQVSPVTVSVGGNDAADVIAETCGGDAACVRQTGLREHLGQNLDHILGAVHAAAPDAVIILVAFYNPFSVSHPETNGLWWRHYTTVQKEGALRNGVNFASATAVVNEGNVCQLTFLCTSGDSHPTDAGYQRIADHVFRVAGFDNL